MAESSNARTGHSKAGETATRKKAPAKKAAAKKSAGSSRVSALAASLKTGPTSLRSVPTPTDVASETADLIGYTPRPTPSQDQPEPSPTAGVLGQPTVDQAPVVDTTPATTVNSPEPAPLHVVAAGAESEEPEAEPRPEAEGVPPVEAVAPEPAPAPEATETPAVKEPEKATAKRAAEPVVKEQADLDVEKVERMQALLAVLTGPEHALDNQHAQVSRLTLELPLPLVDAIARWELEQIRRTGQRVYRERLIDLALAALPRSVDKTVARARDLPGWLKYAETEQVGTRVRSSTAIEMKVLKQELKLRREKGTYVRHVQAAAIVDFLASYDVILTDPDA